MSHSSRWVDLETDQAARDSLVNALRVTPFVATLLVSQGIKDPKQAAAFLNPRLSTLKDPFLLPGVTEAVKRLIQAVQAKQRIIVFGDYDVDGISSSVLMIRVLRRLGLSPKPFVPRRLEEGYGLSVAAVERCFEAAQADLFLALDCGTNSSDAVDLIRKKKVDVIIVDHHQASETLVSDCVLINPHLHPESASKWGYFCTVGLVFKLLHGLIKKLRLEGNEASRDVNLKSYLDLVALGTIADLVPLKEENRILTRFGLEEIKKTKKAGLKALNQISGINPEGPLVPTDISFKLAPRINASGRLADATLPIELLLNSDEDECLSQAEELDRMNRKRQQIERGVLKEAMEQLEPQDKYGYVAFDPEWHSGVVGIAAGQLMRHFNRPCIVLGAEGNMAKGSGRSIPGIDLVEVLSRCDSLLTNWGGHPMAVGMSLPFEAVPEFRAQFDAAIRASVTEAFPEPALEINYWLEADDLTLSLLEEFERLQPFGQGNAEPIVGIANAGILHPVHFFGDKNQHIRFMIQDTRGRRLGVTGWKMAERVPPESTPIDLAVKLIANYWNGNKSLQMHLVDWRPSLKEAPLKLR